MSDRTFPENPEPAPTTLAGNEVVTFIRIGARPGELPNLGLAIGREAHRPADRQYVVWDVAFRDGEWTASSGTYDQNLSDAHEELDRRASASL